MNALPYRPDIDGLRALAVVSVVLYHAQLTAFTGGFVGVDVFFVISGYLITGQLLTSIGCQPNWLADFYRRRVLRILPALLVVLAAATAAAWLIFLPPDFTAFLNSLSAATSFSANFFFWTQGGYFSTSVATKPLLHTWSLAIEEQFYLLYPLLLAWLLSRSRRMAARGIAWLALASLLTWLWGSSRHPAASFFFTPTRIWELLLGTLLVFHALPPINSRALRELAGLLGLALIGLPILLSPSPLLGYEALPACLGTALLIGLGQSQTSYANRWLGTRPLVFVGLISYSLYLWHWPLLAFARYWKILPLSTPEVALLLSASLLLAVLSWWLVEQPARRLGGRFAARRVLTVALSLLAIPLIFGLLGAQLQGWPGRVPEFARYQAAKDEHMDFRCGGLAPEKLASEGCILGEASAAGYRFMVWGDSQANALSPAFDQLARQQGIKGRLASYSACPPLPGAYSPTQGADSLCPRYNNAALALLEPGMRVFLVGRWAAYNTDNLLTGENAYLLNDSSSREASLAESRRVFERQLRQTLLAIQARGAQAVLTGVLPHFVERVPDLAFRRPELAKTSRALLLGEAAYTTALLQNIAQETGSAYVDLLSPFCDHEYCHGLREGQILFWDDNHLNTAGARFLMPQLHPAFSAISATAPSPP